MLAQYRVAVIDIGRRTSGTGTRRIEVGTGPPGEKQRGKQVEACDDKGALCPLGPVARRKGRPHAGRYRSRPSPQFSFRCLHARCAALAGGAHPLAGTRICELFGRELKGQRLPELWFESERAEITRLIGAVTGGMHGLVASLTGETSQGRELDLEMLLLPVRPNASSQCGAIGSFAASALPSWFGQDAITALSTRTIRMIEHGARPQIPFGRLSAPVESLRAARQHLVLIPGGRSA